MPQEMPQHIASCASGVHSTELHRLAHTQMATKPFRQIRFMEHWQLACTGTIFLLVQANRERMWVQPHMHVSSVPLTWGGAP